MLLNLGCEAQHAHDLGHASSGEAFSAGDLGLTGDLAGLQEGLPRDGLARRMFAAPKR